LRHCKILINMFYDKRIQFVLYVTFERGQKEGKCMVEEEV
jgi:hypothetical protein